MSLTYRTSIWFKHYNARSGKHVVPVVQRQLPESTTWMTPSTAVFSNMDHRFALETSATTNNRFFSTEPSKGVAAATASDENEKASISNNDMVKIIAETHDLSSAQSARILATVVDTIIDVRINFWCYVRFDIVEMKSNIFFV